MQRQHSAACVISKACIPDSTFPAGQPASTVSGSKYLKICPEYKLRWHTHTFGEDHIHPSVAPTGVPAASGQLSNFKIVQIPHHRLAVPAPKQVIVDNPFLVPTF